MHVDAGFGGHDTHDNLLLAHFKAEYRNGCAFAYGCMGGDIESECGFARCGAAGNNNKVAALESACQFVKVNKPRCNACASAAVLHVFPDLGVYAGIDGAYRLHCVRRFSHCNVVNSAFGIVQNGSGFLLAARCVLRNAGTDADEAAAH